MVFYERFIAKTLLEHGSVFCLQADGQKHVYQVEVEAILWKFLAALEPVCADLEKGGCISCLHAWGPWVVKQLMGMHEFPGGGHGAERDIGRSWCQHQHLFMCVCTTSLPNQRWNNK